MLQSFEAEVRQPLNGWAVILWLTRSRYLVNRR